MEARHLVVVGAGISGLAAAWSAWQAAQDCGLPLRITVLEAGPAVGGKAQSRSHGGDWLTEGGPTGFLDGEPALDRLVALAGLDKLPAEAAAAHRFVVLGGKLREIHAHPLRFAKSGILSPGGLMRALCERWVPGKRGDQDESVWDFGRRRLGAQVADRLLGPMVQGVFAGDAKAISLPAAFPKMAELEREYGSLFRALGARRRAARRAQGSEATVGGPAGPGGVLTSFAAGLQALPLALAERAPFAIECGRSVVRIEPIVAQASGGAREPRWVVHTATASDALVADGVILATEGWASARLLGSVAPGVAAELAGIDYPPVSVVSLGYPPGAARHFPAGFGCLIPRGEAQRALGFLWDSQLFAGRAPKGHVLVRGLYAGAVDRRAADWSQETLLSTAQAEVAALFGVQAAPLLRTSVQWAQAIPQYQLGHLARVQRVEDGLRALQAQHAPLDLAGNALYGVAFGKAAARGMQVGEARVRAWAAMD